MPAIYKIVNLPLRRIERRKASKRYYEKTKKPKQKWYREK